LLVKESGLWPAAQRIVFKSARFLDSIIVGDGHYFSFCDERLLKK
jgi:DNA repair protein RadC